MTRITLLGLVHFGVTFNEPDVDGGKNLLAQTVFFEQVTKAQEAALSKQSLDVCIQTGKLLVQRDVVQHDNTVHYNGSSDDTPAVIELDQEIKAARQR